MREKILKHVLKNVIEHGKANPKIILGKIMASEPELRKKSKEVSIELNKIISEIEKWDDSKKEKELLKIWPDALKKKENVKKEALKALPNMKDKLVMRFAPNPNGPPTLGSSRGIVINGEYCKKYGGKFICRFDDTDPSLKKPWKEA